MFGMNPLRALIARFTAFVGRLVDERMALYRGITTEDLRRILDADNDARERAIGHAVKRWHEQN